jgi:hypothetical protein
MKKNMSPKQIAANRRNARKSTGPKTAEGREISRMNAVKHGILAKEVVVRGRVIKENGREFAEMHRRFVEELDPVGPVEEMLVEQIVTARWRLRRALRAESGEIALSVDGGQWRRGKQDPVMQWMLWGHAFDPAYSMGESSIGNSMLSLRLGEVRKAVEKEGELTDAAVQILDVGGKPNSLMLRLAEFRSKFIQNPEGLAESERKELHLKEVLGFLDRESRLLSWRTEECEERERKKEEAQQAADVLPSMEVLEKIMRYETKLERQLFRSMAQLERLQRMRRGEAVPPPLAMEVSHGL